MLRWRSMLVLTASPACKLAGIATKIVDEGTLSVPMEKVETARQQLVRGVGGDASVVGGCSDAATALQGASKQNYIHVQLKQRSGSSSNLR
jgi:hypothetical protein